MKILVKNYIIILCGFLIFTLFIWLRFIRTRLPRNIPFDLYFRAFIILIIICVSYLLILKHLIKKDQKPNIYLEHITSILYKPLKDFDTFLKQYISVETIITKLMETLDYTIRKTNIFYLFFAIIPRMILVSVLVYDVFIFHKLHYIYYFVYLAIFLFSHRYIIYSIKNYMTLQCNIMEKNINHITTAWVQGIHPDETDEDLAEYGIPPTMSLPFQTFITFQTTQIMQGFVSKYSIGSSEYYDNCFRKKQNLCPGKSHITGQYIKMLNKEIESSLRNQIEFILKLNLILEAYNITHQENTQFKNIKVIIYALYFICWVYILLKSCPYAHWDEIATTFFKTVFYEVDPFIGIIIIF